MIEERTFIIFWNHHQIDLKKAEKQLKMMKKVKGIDCD